MELPKDIKDEIWQYCMANDITDINGFILTLVKSGFTIEKYGYDPNGNKPETKIVEKEVVKEVIKEVVKEVPVEKIVKVSDDSEINKLLTEINELNIKHSAELSEYDEKVRSLEEKITELEKNKNNTIQSDIYGERIKGRMGSNLLD
jgi:vacuolar-type H+-ATPase subunit I/STV1